MVESHPKRCKERIMKHKKAQIREEKLSECLLCDELPEINQILYERNHHEKSSLDSNLSLKKDRSEVIGVETECKQIGNDNLNDCQHSSIKKSQSNCRAKKEKRMKTVKKTEDKHIHICSRLPIALAFIIVLGSFFSYDYLDNSRNNLHKLTGDIEGKYLVKLESALEQIAKQNEEIKTLKMKLSKQEEFFINLSPTLKALEDQVMNIDGKIILLEKFGNHQIDFGNLTACDWSNKEKKELEKMKSLFLEMKAKLDLMNMSQNIYQKSFEIDDISELKTRILNLDANLLHVSKSVHELENNHVPLAEELKALKSQQTGNIAQISISEKIQKEYENASRVILSKTEAEISNALKVSRADSLALPDFAWKASGGRIHGSHHSDTCSFGNPTIKLFGLPLYVDPSSPRLAISSEHNPGDCWHMKGNQGYLVIKLATEIKPSMISLEHLDKNIDRYSKYVYLMAPKDFEVYAWIDKNGQERVHLGTFTYLREGDAIQTFQLVKNAWLRSVLFVEFRILSNWGNSDCTCIYRVRVHGVSNSWNDEQ